MLTIRQPKRGDTLVEVLFAVTIFSLVAVGGIAIMNQGTATAQRALEITLVRQQIDAQAETLRFMHTSYVDVYQPEISYAPTSPAGQWSLMTKMIKTVEATAKKGASEFTDAVQCPSAPAGSFILNSRSASFVDPGAGMLQSAQSYSQVMYDQVSNLVTSSQGIWIEAVRSGLPIEAAQQNVGFIDFHIRACWDSPGQSIPVTLGTIVRLYEPRG